MPETEPEQATEQPLDEIEQSELGHTGSKQNGNNAEEWVKSQYNLEGQDPAICPEAAHDAVDPRTNTPVEIKSCVVRYNGSGGRGTFQIWDYAHELLEAHDGVYVFVVHEPRTEDFHVYYHRPLSPSEVDAAVASWHEIDHDLRPDDAARTEISQSAVFSDIEVDRIEAETDSDDGGKPQVERMHDVIEIIREIEEQHTDSIAPHDVVVAQLQDKGLDDDQIEHHLDHLKKHGEIYQPREGAYRAV